MNIIYTTYSLLNSKVEIFDIFLWDSRKIYRDAW